MRQEVQLSLSPPKLSPNIREYGNLYNALINFLNSHLVCSALQTHDGCVKNACTLVPTVFLRPRKTEFKLPVSPSFCLPTPLEKVFRFPSTLKTGNLNFYFRFSFSITSYNGIAISIPFFIFCFRRTLENGI